MIKTFAIALCALAAAGAASAQTASVRFGDLDLTTQAGVQRLENRIGHAAGRACASEIGSGPGLTGSAVCERAFRDDAMRAMPIATREQVAATRSATVLVAAR